jgi:transcriptional regulator with AAA-type ATPase domain
MHQKMPKISNELITQLENYHFPGNIRELQGMIIDAVTRATKSEDMSPELFQFHLTKQLITSKQPDTICPFANMTELSESKL